MATASSRTPVAPRAVCIPPAGLTELSGLATDARRWFAVADGGQALRVVVLDRNCDVVDEITASTDPYDVEDLALATDGALWLADTGDNDLDRETAALHRLTRDGHATLFRLSFPDGPHDVEALLLDRSGTPFLVTKNAFGDASVYRPASPLTSPGPTPLERVGEVSVGPTDTPGGPIGALGSATVTGGAVSADGRVVALRTYTDAYLFPAPSGDVLRALSHQPVRVPLPEAPQGEAIALSPGGTLLAASEDAAPIRAVPNALDLLPHRPGAAVEDSAGGTRAPADSGESSTASPWLMALLAAAGATAIMLLLPGRRG